MTNAIIEFKGANGRLELHENYIRIDRGTTMGFLLHGLKGKKDIYFDKISSIQIKKPGFTVGYVQFSLSGGKESRGGVFDSAKDENTITFNGEENYEKVLKIKEYIEKKSSRKSPMSDADELEKLYGLMKKGIITKNEFESQKKKLLS